MKGTFPRGASVVLALLVAVAGLLVPPGTEGLAAQATPPYTRADTLRGSVTPERAWWDVTFYDLALRVRPEDRAIEGSVGIVYEVVDEPREMQLDLQPPLVVDSVIHDGRRLEVRRDSAVFWVDPRPPTSASRGGAEVGGSSVGTLDSVRIHYRGEPRAAVNPPWDGGFVWAADSVGNAWVGTANQGLGASVWWPNKDTQREEPDSQRIAITVPDELVAVSNGRLRGVPYESEGVATYEWFVHAPINNYNVTVNLGEYAHMSEFFYGAAGALTLDYWPLAYHAEEAREQFEQVPRILTCFEAWFGPYPWYADGFKLVETPYLGMEHQSAIAYGNRYQDGYLGQDLSGTGLGLEWDYILVHETAHEWWGNNITTEDLADLWVHEGFGTYAEGLYVECLEGREAGGRYLRGLRSQVAHDAPVIPAYGVNAEGSGDMYFKGANMLHTIRQVVDEDLRWLEILRGLNREFRHSVVTGDQVRAYVSEQAGMDLEPVFRQYLTTPDIPMLELSARPGGIGYRWAGVVDGFDMPVDVRIAGAEECVRLEPTSDWQVLEDAGDPEDVAVDRDFYVRVARGSSGADPSGAGGSDALPEGDC